MKSMILVATLILVSCQAKQPMPTAHSLRPPLHACTIAQTSDLIVEAQAVDVKTKDLGAFAVFRISSVLAPMKWPAGAPDALLNLRVGSEFEVFVDQGEVTPKMFTESAENQVVLMAAWDSTYKLVSETINQGLFIQSAPGRFANGMRYEHATTDESSTTALPKAALLDEIERGLALRDDVFARCYPVEEEKMKPTYVDPDAGSQP